MAGVYTLKRQTVEGDMRVSIYTVTNFTNTETVTIKSMRQIYHAIAQIGTQDKSIGVTIGTGSSANVLTIACGADTYDGTLKVYGK